MYPRRLEVIEGGPECSRTPRNCNTQVRVDRPNAVYARQLQELLGGKYGEMSVMTQYLFQGWGQRGDAGDPRLRRLKDMLLDTGTEEIAHVEMLATCIALLLDSASAEVQEEAARSNPVVCATLGEMNPQHMIVSGLSALPADSVGTPWSGAYATASGNIIPDLSGKATAEMHGRLQACRMYEMTTCNSPRGLSRMHAHASGSGTRYLTGQGAFVGCIALDGGRR